MELFCNTGALITVEITQWPSANSPVLLIESNWKVNSKKYAGHFCDKIRVNVQQKNIYIYIYISNGAPETIELLKTLLKYNLEKLLKKPKI